MTATDSLAVFSLYYQAAPLSQGPDPVAQRRPSSIKPLRFFPASRGRSPFHAFVVREHDATLSHTVGTARLRPSSRTRFGNLFLAGDWTATGLPATIEGAVQSGQECARMVLE